MENIIENTFCAQTWRNQRDDARVYSFHASPKDLPEFNYDERAKTSLISRQD